MQLKSGIGLSVIVGINDGLIGLVGSVMWRGVKGEFDCFMVVIFNINGCTGFIFNLDVV